VFTNMTPFAAYPALLAAWLSCSLATAFVAPTTAPKSHANNIIILPTTFKSRSALLSTFLDRIFSSTPTKQDPKSSENGLDPDYPWCFTGRLWFRPALVRIQDSNTQALDEAGIFSILNIFGYTLGGTVALEYDTSPVGPYREYVSMGALVACTKKGMVGQWGSRLYVSTPTAEEICQQVWGVPAELMDIQFMEEGSSLQVTLAPDPLLSLSSSETATMKARATTRQKQTTIQVTGWSKTRVSEATSPVRGGIPILWTPTIKALWLQLVPSFLVPFDSGEGKKGGLPVHRLRLSASSISLQLCGQEPSDLLGIPLGIGLSVDNVLIEIGREEGVL
jgi:hypothetical protein